jgi:putative cell wall-binding protein
MGINTLMIATGRNFPDALSAVPAANAFGVGALLLVDGSRTTLDSETQAILEDRSTAEFYVVGGTGSVSAPLASAISAISPTTRLSGPDRYATSVAVAFHFFVESDEAFIANGSGFADALAAGPVASRAQAPVYLSRATCMPVVVRDDVLSVYANRIVLVGGSAVLSDSVASLTSC